MTIREVAARLRISTATAYKLCERGTLRSTRVLNSIRVREIDLDELVRRSRKGDPA